MTEEDKMELISIALGLAKVAPIIFDWLKSDDKKGDAAEAVVEIAKTITGQSDGSSALKAINADPNLALQYQLAVLAKSNELDKLYLADTQDARERDTKLAQAGVVNHRANIMAGSALILVIVCLGVVVWMADINDFAKGSVTLILGRALGWVEQIFSFEFGTTRSSKSKDDTINNLSK